MLQKHYGTPGTAVVSTEEEGLLGVLLRERLQKLTQDGRIVSHSSLRIQKPWKSPGHIILEKPLPLTH
jgi:hypothetical protein